MKLKNADEYISIIETEFPYLYVRNNTNVVSSLNLTAEQFIHLINKFIDEVPEEILGAASKENPLGIIMQAQCVTNGSKFLASLDLYNGMEKIISYCVEIDSTLDSPNAIGGLIRTKDEAINRVFISEEEERKQEHPDNDEDNSVDDDYSLDEDEEERERRMHFTM